MKELLDNAASYTDDRGLPDEMKFLTPTYPGGKLKPEAVPKGVDPATRTVMLFPGQGSQYVGMGVSAGDEAGIMRLYEEASSVLGYDLYKLCTEGPMEKLSQTVHSQPAVVVTSLAALEKLTNHNPEPVQTCIATAGFSVGEITALIFAGAFSLEDGLKLVALRAELMARCCTAVESGMMTVWVSAESRVEDACSIAVDYCTKQGLQQPVCDIANYISPVNKVLAGHHMALKFIEDNRREFGIKRVKHLPVSGAFHTALMRPAVKEFSDFLSQLHIEEPLIPVCSNVSGVSYGSVSNIVKVLPEQMCSPVKWEQTMHHLYKREQGISFPNTYECGPGKSLVTILKTVNRKAATTAYNITM